MKGTIIDTGARREQLKRAVAQVTACAARLDQRGMNSALKKATEMRRLIKQAKAQNRRAEEVEDEDAEEEETPPVKPTKKKPTKKKSLKKTAPTPTPTPRAEEKDEI